jgi:adenylate kinase family enzyme
MVRVVVLLGPPGSGKSTIGRALGARAAQSADSVAAEILAAIGA